MRRIAISVPIRVVREDQVLDAQKLNSMAISEQWRALKARFLVCSALARMLLIVDVERKDNIDDKDHDVD